MKEKPILFNGEMVRAILAGRKTQTRRPVRLRDETQTYSFFNDETSDGTPLGWPMSVDECGVWHRDPCPFGKPGDQLWVRETWCPRSNGKLLMERMQLPFYRANNDEIPPGWKWRPSIHMPRWASRINLEITDIRVERLLDISEEDALAEGIPTFEEGSAHPDCYYGFLELWDSVYVKRNLGADANPWVWVVEFKKAR